MEKDTPLVTRDQIAADLRALGVQSGPVILMHAVVKSIGRVGASDSYLFDAAQLAQNAVVWMERVWGE